MNRKVGRELASSTTYCTIGTIGVSVELTNRVRELRAPSSNTYPARVYYYNIVFGSAVIGTYVAVLHRLVTPFIPLTSDK